MTLNRCSVAWDPQELFSSCVFCSFKYKIETILSTCLFPDQMSSVLNPAQRTHSSGFTKLRDTQSSATPLLFYLLFLQKNQSPKLFCDLRDAHWAISLCTLGYFVNGISLMSALIPLQNCKIHLSISLLLVFTRPRLHLPNNFPPSNNRWVHLLFLPDLLSKGKVSHQPKTRLRGMRIPTSLGFSRQKSI